jgi:hypothetical protein
MFFKGETIDSKKYVSHILPLAKKEGYRLFGTREWVYQQDGATQTWCRNHLYKFMDKTEWPPSSPDLNPLDFYYWNAVVREINVNLFINRDEFQAEIDKAMKCVSKDEIRKSMQSFSKRVREIEVSEGRYIKKLKNFKFYT